MDVEYEKFFVFSSRDKVKNGQAVLENYSLWTIGAGQKHEKFVAHRRRTEVRKTRWTAIGVAPKAEKPFGEPSAWRRSKKNLLDGHRRGAETRKMLWWGIGAAPLLFRTKRPTAARYLFSGFVLCFREDGVSPFMRIKIPPRKFSGRNSLKKFWRIFNSNC